MFLPNWLRPRRPVTIRRQPIRLSRFIRLHLEALEERITPTGPVTIQPMDAPPAPGKVLILDPTVVNGANSLEAQEAIKQGFTVDVVSPSTWSSMTAAQFASYRAIVLGDPSEDSPSPYLDAPVANESVWGPVVNGSTGGNVIIIGTDPVNHANGSDNPAGARNLIKSAMDFVLNTPAGKTGIYIDLSRYYGSNSTPTKVPLLDVFKPGGFTVHAPDCFDSGHVVATTSDSSLGSLTDADLSKWNCSVHEAFDTFDPSFDVVAIDENAGSSYTASDGTQGDPYILARGTNLHVISNIQLAPAADSPAVGTNETLTATVTSSANGTTTPLAGVTVTFTVISGPNAGTKATAITNTNGQATFTYSSSVAGIDFVHAQFVDSNGHTETSGNSQINWIVVQRSTTTVVSPITASCAAQDEYVTLSANVTANISETGTGDPVPEGQVVFTVYDANNKQVDGPVTGKISGGTATALFKIPAGTPVGTYKIVANYSDTVSNNFKSSSGNGTLTIKPCPTRTTVDGIDVPCPTENENITLKAMVAETSSETGSNNPISNGKVTFMIFNANNQVVATITPNPAVGDVVNGAATATITITPNTPSGFYTIVATYSDSSGMFVTSTGYGTMIIKPCTTITSPVPPVSALCAGTDQQVSLTTTVTEDDGTPVNEGTVTFTVVNPKNNAIIGTPVTYTLTSSSNGVATVNYTIPAGTPIGTYTIKAHYTDSNSLMLLPSDNVGTLTISLCPTTVFNVTATPSTVYSCDTTTVTLSAQVTSPGKTINDGYVTFTVGTLTPTPIKADVHDNVATTSIVVPAGTIVGTYTISATYTDPNGMFQDFPQDGNPPATGTLNVSLCPTNVTNVAVAPTTIMACNSTSGTVSAKITSPDDTVDGGTVTFTFLDASQNPVSTITPNPISNVPVVKGVATAPITFAADIPAGTYTYTVMASYSGVSNMFDTSKSSGTLTLTVQSCPTTIAPAVVTPPTVIACDGNTVTVSTKITSPGGPAVSEGLVDFIFTAPDGTQLKSPGNHVNSDGTVGATVPITMETHSGSYNLTVSYTDAPNHIFADQTITVNNALTVQMPTTAISVPDVTTTYSPSSQPITLTAMVTSKDCPPVNLGSVIFTLTNAKGTVILTTGPITVSNNQASTTVTVPAGQDVGDYTIKAVYSDSSNHYVGSTGSGTLHIVSIVPKPVSVPRVGVPFTFFDNDPNLNNQITLTANITDANGVPLNEGQVTFSVTDSSGNPVGVFTPASSNPAPVSNGQAKATFTVSQGTPLGNYIITANYSDASTNHYASSSSTGTLAVVPANTTVTITSVNIVWGLLGEQEVITAYVVGFPQYTSSNPTGAGGFTVNEGTVTFSDSGQTMTVPVANSVATATLTIPLLNENPNTHSITATYSPSSSNYITSSSDYTINQLQIIFEYLLQIMIVEMILNSMSSHS